MSAQDKARVKAAVSAYLADPERTIVTPGDVARHCRNETRLDFAATTIARYMTAEGWERVAGPASYGVRYQRSAGKSV